MYEGACACAPRARVDMWAGWAYLAERRQWRSGGSEIFPDLDEALMHRPQLGHLCLPEAKTCGAARGLGDIRRSEAQQAHLIRIVWAAGGPG